MPGIVALVDLLSLEVTRALVLAGYGLDTLAITGATNTTPIVITTASAHGIDADGAHVIVSGVLGNTAANNIDASANSPTKGQNLAVVATPISETELELSAVAPLTGILAPLAGSGAYTSGGTMQAALASPNVPFGKIYLGREHVDENSAAPRIVFVPVRSAFGPRSTANRNVAGNAVERAAQIAARSIGTEKVTFEVHAWGQADPPDPRNDFDATQVLYQQVIQSTHLLCAGIYEASSGAWADQVAGSTQMVKAGHEFVFGLTIETPILDKALPYAPSDIAALPTTNLQPADGSAAEVSCTG
jgi:hypothetical protein